VAGPARPGAPQTCGLPELDLLFVRDNCGGVYQGRWRVERDDRGETAHHAFSYSESEVRRLARVAVSLAANRRGRVHVIVKHGGVPAVSDLWQRVALEVATPHPVQVVIINADFAAFELVQHPELFDVILTPNLFGDILVDLSAVLQGSRGVTFSGNFAADGRAVYQTNHGCAHDLAGTDTANPAGQLLALAMLLRESFDLPEAAALVESGLAAAWDCGVPDRGCRGARLPGVGHSGDGRSGGPADRGPEPGGRGKGHPVSPVLLLIDLQRDFLEGDGPLQPHAGLLVRRAAALLEGFRRRQLPVLHLWTTVRPGEPHRFAHWRGDRPPRCVAGSAGHETPAPLRPIPGEGIVHKRGYNPFAEGDLEARLSRLGSGAVVLAGVHLHACVRTAAVECLERGYAVSLAEDAVGTNDPIHGAAVQRWLSDRGAAFLTVADLLDSSDRPADRCLRHRSPRALDQVLFEVQPAGADAVAVAVNAARNSRARWGSTPLEFRLERLGQLASALRSNAPRFAQQMAIEIGKPLAQGIEEMQRAAANVEDVARRIAAAPVARPAPAWVRSRPLGVVAIITPWNNPVAIPVGKIAPALAFGNSVVWKPAPAGTRLARATLELLHAAGFPEDIVQWVEGDAATVRHLVRAPGVDAVTFTGSTFAGYAVQELCSARCVPLQAELGGNNAAILWDDADPVAAAGEIAWGAFGFAGQRCTANRRVIVPRTVARPFSGRWLRRPQP
jgi:alpha-ketoglutaric semialdehyde dehydrogenase